MNGTAEKLCKLQTEINSQDDKEWIYKESLMFCKSNDLFKIFFFGDPRDNSFYKVLKVLSEKEIAEKVYSLSFDSPDIGANGTNNFDFSVLTDKKTVFPEIRHFSVKQTQPNEHNRTIIAEVYDEEGKIAELIKKMPNLLSLQIPSAPNEDFFDLRSHPLEYLQMQVGYDTQNFILNLSNSTCFERLWHFDFTDYQETYGENWENDCTPFEHFERLFNSKSFNSVKKMILRNLTYTDEQIKKLKSLRENIHFNLIRTKSKYIY